MALLNRSNPAWVFRQRLPRVGTADSPLYFVEFALRRSYGGCEYG